MPYTESGVSMVVLADKDDKSTMWIFLQPLTKNLWFATMGFFFFTGLIVWVIERHENRHFQGSRLKQFSTAFYFTFFTLTFSHDQIIKSILSKIVVVIWCFVVLVLAQSYTASLSSMLTAERLQTSVTDVSRLLRNGDYVGYQNGPFVRGMLERLQFDERKIRVYGKPEEYAEALRNGSKNGGVSAIFDEIPYLASFLSQYGDDFQMVGPMYKTDGFGFESSLHLSFLENILKTSTCLTRYSRLQAFPKGSPLVPDLSRAILNLTEGDEGLQIETKWFGEPNPSLGYGSHDSNSSPPNLRSFAGLFIITGCVSVVMMLINIGKFIYRNRAARTADLQGVQNGGENAGNEEPNPVQNGVGNNTVPTSSLLMANTD